MNDYELEIIRQALRVAILTDRQFYDVVCLQPFNGMAALRCVKPRQPYEYYAWVLIHKGPYGKDGYSYFGYDREGFHRDGYDRDGFDKGWKRIPNWVKTYDCYGQWYGYDREGYDRHGFDENGLNREGKPAFEISKDEILKL